MGPWSGQRGPLDSLAGLLARGRAAPPPPGHVLASGGFYLLLGGQPPQSPGCCTCCCPLELGSQRGRPHSETQTCHPQQPTGPDQWSLWGSWPLYGLKPTLNSCILGPSAFLHGRARSPQVPAPSAHCAPHSLVDDSQVVSPRERQGELAAGAARALVSETFHALWQSRS